MRSVGPLTLLFLATLAVPASTWAQEPTINLRRTPTVEVVEKTRNSVVSIISRVRVAQRINPFGNDPFFRNFDVGTQFVPGDSLGSGFVVHRDGYVVTNNHVVDRAQSISVKFVDGRTLDAELLSADADADLAILKLKSDTNFTALELGDSSDLMMGEPVIAVGNPLGYSHSVSTGIVSAIHRDLQADARTQLQDLIQTDAAINRGNSGGPLLNAYGQVIGINTAIRGDAQNIGFAIQVNKLRDLIPDLMSPAQIAKLDIPLRLKEQRKLSPPAKVESTLVRDSDDVTIRTIGGVAPRDIVDAYAILLKQKLQVPFEVSFAGKPSQKLTPTLVAPPDALVKAKQRLGVVVEPVTPVIAGKLELPIEYGMLIQDIVPGSVADKAGFQPGDVLLRVGTAPLASVDRLGWVLNQIPDGVQFRVQVLRGQSIGYAILQL